MSKMVVAALSVVLVLSGCTPSNMATTEDVRSLQAELRALRSALDAQTSEVLKYRSDLITLTSRFSTISAPTGQQSVPNFPAQEPAGQRTLSPPAPTSAPQDNNPVVNTTPSGQNVYQGPRGGIYHYSPSGKKVYEKKRK